MVDCLKQSSPSKQFICATLLQFILAGYALPQGTSTPQVPPSTQLKNLSLEQLGNVEVTSATKAPQEVWNTAAAIYVISHDEIERSGATTIPDALRLAPGVEVARIDGNKWSIGIRGFGSRLARSVLVLIDGRSVYTTFLAGTFWEVQDTFMDDIERIEVIRGPGGTIWGPNAVNGVINIITRESKDTHGFLASAGGGNVERGFGNVRYGGGSGDGFDYRVYGKGFNRSAQFHPDGRNVDDWQGGQAGFRMDWEKSTRDSYTLQGDLYRQSAGESVQAVNYNPPGAVIVDTDAELSGGNITGRWKRTFGEGKDIQLQTYYDRTNRHEVNFGDIRNTFDADFLQRFPWGSRQQISWGLGARFSHGNELQVVSGLTFDPPQRTDRLYTAFVQDQIEIVPQRLSLTVGTKLLKTNYTGAEFEPSARLLYTPTATQTLWAAFTRAVRTPSDIERDLNVSAFLGTLPGGVPFFARFNANHDFRSERMLGYEVGYRRLITPKIYFDLAGFFNQYHDLFSQDITGPAFLETTPAPLHALLPAQFGNGLMATTEGFEIAPEWRPASFWRLRGSYSFLQMHVEKEPGSQDIGSAPIIQGASPKHQVMMQSGFDISKALTADFQFRYISALISQRVPAYSTADATLQWRVNHNVRLSVAGRNLFQPHHPEALGDPRGLLEIKRSVYGKITWTSNSR